jgi:hypothetical protein
MALKIPNIDFIRSITTADQLAQLGPKLAEALQGIAQGVDNGQMQTNSNPNGEPLAPPAVNGMKVTGQNGHFQVAIQHDGDIYRGVKYFVEHADNPNFTDSQTVKMSDSRNANLTLGNVDRYFRAYAAYDGSPPGPAVYHGDAGTPLMVNGGGAQGGPAFLPSEGSGTGTPGQGLQGPGTNPFRSKTGAPPERGGGSGSEE